MNRFALAVLLAVAVVPSSCLFAKPQRNAPRASGEPHWEGKVILRGEAKAVIDATPILERPYRPLHVYGNMQRRHHYRDTVVPSNQDRSEMIKAFLHRNDHPLPISHYHR